MEYLDADARVEAPDCPDGKVCNPVTGHLVSVNGKIGRQVLAARRIVSTRSVADQVRDLMRAHEYVLVDFWLKDCEPCEELDAILPQVAARFEGLVITKVEAEDSEELLPEGHASEVGFPTLWLYRVGKLIDEDVDFGSLDVLTEALESHLEPQTTTAAPAGSTT